MEITTGYNTTTNDLRSPPFHKDNVTDFHLVNKLPQSLC